MKFARIMLAVVLVAITTAAVAQSDAEKSFKQIKDLAGTWEGRVTMDPPMSGVSSTLMHVTMRVTSRGNALVHEMAEAGKADDPTKNDHPVTMVYMEGDQLVLTHYCDAGNRPHMAAKPSPDGKVVEFGFVDVSGSTQHGRMDHAVFTIADANHHSEEWTFLMPGDKLMHARMDLQRVK